MKLDTVRRAWLVREANARGITLSELMREAIDVLRVKSELERLVVDRVKANRAAYPAVGDSARFIRDCVRAGKMPYDNTEGSTPGDSRPLDEKRWINDVVHLLLRNWRERIIDGEDLSASAYVEYAMRRTDFAAFPAPEPMLPFDESPIKNNTDASFGGHDVGVDRSKPPDKDRQEAKIE